MYERYKVKLNKPDIEREKLVNENISQLNQNNNYYYQFY